MKEDFHVEEGESDQASVDATVAAMDQRRVNERRLEEAKSEEEREQIRSDRNIYRLSLTFTNEEATTVKQALGSSPADVILGWCTAAVAAQQTTETGT